MTTYRSTLLIFMFFILAFSAQLVQVVQAEEYRVAVLEFDNKAEIEKMPLNT